MSVSDALMLGFLILAAFVLVLVITYFSELYGLSTKDNPPSQINNNPNHPYEGW